MKLRYILYCFLLLISCKAFSQAPTEFIENKGQWGSWVKYKATTMGGDVTLENDGFRFILCDPSNVLKMDSFHHGQLQKNPLMRFHVYKLTFEGANVPDIQGLKPQKTYYNYYLGNDPQRWKSGIHPCLALDYNDLYKGINMHVTTERGALIYEFFVQPQADVTQVKLNFDGPEKMFIKDGNLVINTSVGKVVEMKPDAYQYIDNNKVNVACNYRLENNKVTFDFPDGYDHSAQLIIDPTIAFWCSFTGSTADNWGFTATYDEAGDFYLGGLVNALPASAGGFGGSYPVTPGAYQSTYGGGQGNSGIEYAADIGIMKLSPDGTSRIYATYLGGSANERPHSLIVDPSGNLIVAGRTHSTDFPITAGAFQTTNGGGWDIIVSKLNATGTALLASTYVGGSADDGVNFDSTEVGYGHLKWNYGDDARSEVQIDNAGNIYVTGSTESSNFPTTATAISTTFGGGLQDGVVFKMNSTLTSMLWGTYLGGTGDDAGYVLAFNSSQTALYVAGGTNSTNFPVPAGGWESTYMGDSADGYVLKFKNSPPYNVIKGTFVGTSHFDQVYGIQVDGSDNVYVMGQSLGGTFPVTAGAYVNANSSQFVMKMDSTLTTDLISTVYGSGDPLHTNISPVAFLVDTCQNVYISGWGGNIMGAGAPGLAHSGTTTGMPTSPDGHMLTTDGYDFYFVVFSPGITSIRYATFYGRNAPGGYGEHVDGGTSRFDKHGIIYQAICANCGGTSGPAFPTTAGVWAPVDGSTVNCNEAALKISFNIGPVAATITAGPNVTGCAPLTVNFTNTSNNAISYVWNFGDGSPVDTDYAPTHTYTVGGTFTVTLSAANSSACFKTTDTAYLIINVDTNSVAPGFTYNITDSCGPYNVSFTNTTVLHTSGTPTYQWWFGNGTYFAGAVPTSQSYSGTGSYTVTLVVTDTTACNSPDTLTRVIHITNTGPVTALSPGGPYRGCLPVTINFNNASTNATSYQWFFGDGSASSTATNPTHTFTSGGTFTVTLVADNPNSCFRNADTTYLIVQVDTNVIMPGFTDMVMDSCGPYTVSFTNTSTAHTTGNPTYQWWFGNGTVFSGMNPTVQSYPDTGLYTITLVMTDTTACNSPDTVTRKVHVYSYNVAAHFTIPDSICAGTSFTPSGGATNATVTLWTASGGHSSSGAPAIRYDSVGTDTVTLYASNPGACNGADTFIQTIKILPVPIANFTYAPITPVPNVPTTFSNLSVNANRYSWDFGDNNGSTEEDPVHQYTKTGTYKVCLTAYNNSNCPSTVCKLVQADVDPEIGLPTAFSPNGDGENDILYVRGAAITTMDLKIFNRWGQLVFETTTLNHGWDGTFNGQPQPIDAYAYVLNVSFIDGSAKLLKGNITLLR